MWHVPANTNAPPGSTLVHLSELPAQAVGAKVRFRGCVSSYAHTTGTLYLTARHPAPPTVALDIALVREAAKGPSLMTGAWVSVIGYVTAHAARPRAAGLVLPGGADADALASAQADATGLEFVATASAARRGAVGSIGGGGDEDRYVATRVQAVTLWNADAVGSGKAKLEWDYEEGVKARKHGMALMRRSREVAAAERDEDAREARAARPKSWSSWKGVLQR